MRNRLLLPLSFLLAVAGVACGATDSGSLLGGDGYGKGAGNGESSGNGSTGGPTGNTLGAGDDDGNSTGPGGTTTLADGGVASDDAGSPTRAMFEALLPSFNTTCGGACHASGGANAPAYLGGADPYATIKAFPGIVVSSPAASILMTKGAHEGPALANPLEASILAWLTAEAPSVPTGPATTNPITVATGNNTVDLSSLGVSGLSLSFTATLSGDIMTLSNMAIAAPATTGVSITYPVFYVNGAAGAQTENSDMSDDQQTVGAGTSDPLDTGLLILSGWAAGDTLQVGFNKLAKATVADAGSSGGCKDVPSFTTNAVPAIKANTCLNCHNTGGSGNAALDLSGLAATPENDTAACAQALTRINTTTPAQSDIILAPTGGVANHPFKTAPASFVTMMETWIQAEK